MTVIGLLVPVALYGRLYGGVSNVMPARAKELLRGSSGEYVLVDVRPADKYAERHIDGAEHWPLADILSCGSSAGIPEKMATGQSSQFARWASVRLRRPGTSRSCPEWRVLSVRGGIQEWIASAAGAPADTFDRFRTGDGRVSGFPQRQMSRIEQWLAVLSGYRPDQADVHGFVADRGDRTLAQQGSGSGRPAMGDDLFLHWRELLRSQLAGVRGHIVFSEYLHGAGMLLCFGFATYAILEGMDRRVLMLSSPDRRCAALSLCERCIKHTDAPCGFRRVFMVLIPALMVVACMPLTADRSLTSYNTEILVPLTTTHTAWRTSFSRPCIVPPQR